jgi:hypothetical protein
MTLSLVQPDPSLQPFVEAVAIRLADEGIPIRAIARATRLAPGSVYETLRDAIGRGAICEMPKDDWPSGQSRQARAPFVNPAFDEAETFKFACARCFKATPQEAAILATLLKRRECTKEQLHVAIEQGRSGESQKNSPTAIKIIDVFICKLRKKLTPHNIKIETVWSQGYMISAENRERAINMLNEYAGEHVDAIAASLQKTLRETA